MRIGLIQLTVTDDPVANLATTLGYVRQAQAQGAQFILTPECTNGLWSDRAAQKALLRGESDDPTLAALREEAAKLGIWLLIGSIALVTGDADGRFANRSFLIGPDGTIAARYDKIHMFDVNVSATEVYRESAAFRPGHKAVVAQTPFATLGLSVCYDVRFPHLYRALAQGGAQILTVPAAFNHITGAALGKPCCARVRLRTALSCWPPPRPAFTPKPTARAAAPMATAWRSALGARCWPMAAPNRG